MRRPSAIRDDVSRWTSDPQDFALRLALVVASYTSVELGGLQGLLVKPPDDLVHRAMAEVRITCPFPDTAPTSHESEPPRNARFTAAI